jgi:hypothetical protein
MYTPTNGEKKGQEHGVYFVFTIREMMPGTESEFESALNEINPDYLFVEISAEDFNNRNFSGYAAEMIYAAEWAGSKNIAVVPFDFDMDVRSSLGGEDRGSALNIRSIRLPFSVDYLFF